MDDRAEWLLLRAEVEAQRNNLRAVVEYADSLEGTVLAFLEARRAVWVKTHEIQIDLKLMRKHVRARHRCRVRPGRERPGNDLESDVEDDVMDEAVEAAGA